MSEKCSFKSFDGTELVGVYTAADKTATNAILMVHGLPSDKDEWGFYTDMAEFFRGHGASCLRFDFRYCGNSAPGQLQHLVMSELINDIEAGYWALLERIGDKLPVSLVATSAGGGIAVRWTNVFKRKLHRIFLMAPVLDYELEVTGVRRDSTADGHKILDASLIAKLAQEGRLNDDAGYGRQMLNDAHTFDAIREFASVATPTTIFHGSDDTVVPVAISRQLASRAGDVELIEIPGSDHGFAAPGDDDLTAPETKQNHRSVYQALISRLK